MEKFFAIRLIHKILLIVDSYNMDKHLESSAFTRYLESQVLLAIVVNETFTSGGGGELVCANLFH